MSLLNLELISKIQVLVVNITWFIRWTTCLDNCVHVWTRLWYVFQD